MKLNSLSLIQYPCSQKNEVENNNNKKKINCIGDIVNRISLNITY